MNITKNYITQGYNLLDKYAESQYFSARHARRWIDTIEDSGNAEILGIWGKLTRIIVLQNANKKLKSQDSKRSLVNALDYVFANFIDNMDLHRVKKYFDALHKLNMVNTMDYYTCVYGNSGRCIYEGLLNVANALTSSKAQVHPIVEGLLIISWDPTKLLETLNSDRRIQTEYMRDNFNELAQLKDTAQGQLLQAMLPAFISDLWIPNDAVAKQLWNIYSPQDSNYSFVEKMANAHPSTSSNALLCLYSNSRNMSEKVMNSFFPLQLEKGPVDNIAEYLIQTWLAKDLHTFQMVSMIKQNHPKLAEIMDVHFVLFPEITIKNTQAQVLSHMLLRHFSMDASPDIQLSTDHIDLNYNL